MNSDYEAPDAASASQSACETLFRSPSYPSIAVPPGRGWRRSGRISEVRPPPTPTRLGHDHREA